MTAQITVLGMVQGVGYRPFVARLARELGIQGNVKNSGGIVQIIADGNKEAVDDFVHRLKSHTPAGAEVRQVLVHPLPDHHFENFLIITSTPSADEIPLIPPDLPMCEDCRRELYAPSNRRFRYPIISCVACGPRYSIIESLPYDRDTTSMVDFAICPACEDEYTEADDRRCHAQTISCHDCGPQLILESSDQVFHREEALEKGIELLKQGQVLAIKGIGGYQFACLPTNLQAVERLRLLKQRDKKPFAVMFPSLEKIKSICSVSMEEEKLLTSTASPIVLLEKINEIFCEEVSGESRFIGAFLPYTPLQRLLVDACGPLIMTSANLTSEPIITQDEDMLSLHSPFLAGVLYHTRRILTPLDDTVMRVVNDSPQMIRRSRGVTPLPVYLEKSATQPILAMGGDLKSSFCLLAHNKAYLSQYFGDMENFAVTQKYRENLTRMEGIFGIKPQIIVHDLHPGYATTRIAQNLAHDRGIPLRPVQHHHAHVASVLAEHYLTSCIGVAFDGTGCGNDGAIWGGEFLLCKGAEFQRAAHLEYVTLCGGDAGSKEAMITAYSYLAAGGIQIDNNEYKTVKLAIENKINTHQSSSMGRLFDAASGVLGIRSRNSYEGECAIALENAAADHKKTGGKPYPLHFNIKKDGSVIKAVQVGLLNELYTAKKNGADTGTLALGFHRAVADMVVEICEQISQTSGERTVCLSGGVFANLLLVEDCIENLTEHGFKVYINHQVPTNDCGISLGQAWIAAVDS